MGLTVCQLPALISCWQCSSSRRYRAVSALKRCCLRQELKLIVEAFLGAARGWLRELPHMAEPQYSTLWVVVFHPTAAPIT